MAVKVEVRLDAESIADYIVYNIYKSAAGIVSIVLSVFNIALALLFFGEGRYLLMVLFILFTVMLVSVLPYLLRLYIRKKMKNSRKVKETVVYEFGEEGVATTTSDDSGKAPWKKFKRAVSRKYILILYADDGQAIILPIDQLGENYAKITELIYRHMPAPAVRVRSPGSK